MIFSGWLFISFTAVLLANLAAAGNLCTASFRLALLRTVVLWSGLLAVGTELLGTRRWITPLGVSAWWMLVTAAAAAVMLGILGKRFSLSCLHPRLLLKVCADVLRSGWPSIRAITAPSAALLVFLIVWFGFLFAIALVAAPNNFDSMTYRLPRVMHWAAQASVAHYPTEVIRQLDRSPFAEWVLLHIYQLRHTDHWFNLVQWAGFAFLVLAVHELCSRFTNDRRQRFLAVILAATMPMAILQATSTQNNVLQSLFFVLFVFFGLRCSEPDGAKKSAKIDAILCGMALGLSVLTNAVNLVFLVFFALWFLWRLRSHWVRLGIPLALSALLMVAGFFSRNQQLFHSPLGCGGFVAPRSDLRADREEVIDLYRNRKMSFSLYLSNVTRNLFLQMAIPVQSFNEGLHHLAYHGHATFGLTLEEKEVTQEGGKFMLTADRHEDFAGEPLQLLLFVACLVFLPFRWRAVMPEARGVSLGLVVGFALFCLVLEYEPLNPRLILPLFAAACACIPVMLPPLRGWLAGVLAGISVAYAAPCLFDNYRRPAFGPHSVFGVYRPLQYFRDFPGLFPDYDRLIPVLRGKSYSSLGLQTNEHQFHYPFWPMMRHRYLRNMEVYEVNVTNVSKRLAGPRHPDAVLVTYPMSDASLDVDGIEYRRIWSGKSLSLFEKDAASHPGIAP